MSAIEELKQILADEEEQSAEYGHAPPINTEITIEASLVYRLINEWPSDARSEAMNRLREKALAGFADVYKYLEQES